MLRQASLAIFAAKYILHITNAQHKLGIPLTNHPRVCECYSHGCFIFYYFYFTSPRTAFSGSSDLFKGEVNWIPPRLSLQGII